MASPGQQTVQRKYEYGFNGKTGYTRLLKEAHSKLVNQIALEKDQAGAEKLQHFLQNIKDTARQLEEESNQNLNKNEHVAQRLNKLTPAEAAWYRDFVNEVIDAQINRRKRKGLQILNKSLLRREHREFYERHEKELFDDIAEEELGYIFWKLKEKITGKVYRLGSIAGGTEGAYIKGADEYTKIGNDIYNHFVEEFKEIAKSVNQTYTLGDHLVKETRGKSDLNMGTLEINSKTHIKEGFLQELIPLLNDASFTVKNYKNTTFEQWGLTLGHTNLFRSIVAELNIVFENNDPTKQRDIFYRGAQIITKTNRPPSATSDTVMKHFYHMRFIYELSGLGLIDSKSGKPQFVKYLIYNDPISPNIYVQDTASIILDEINKRKGAINTFGTIHLNNVKGYKK